MSECGQCKYFKETSFGLVPMGICKNEESGIKGFVPCYAGQSCHVFESIFDDVRDKEDADASCD